MAEETKASRCNRSEYRKITRLHGQKALVKPQAAEVCGEGECEPVQSEEVEDKVWGALQQSAAQKTRLN